MLDPANESAVSPVVGIVLMLAVTVAIGAVVFIVANGSTQGTPASSTTVSFYRQGDKIQVVGAPNTPKLDWFADITPTGSCAAHVQLTPVNVGVAAPYPTAAGTEVNAGDLLSGCAAGEQLVLSLKTTTTAFYSVSF